MTLRTIFWNPEEARLRSMWRLLAHFATLVVVVLGMFRVLRAAPGSMVATLEFLMTIAVTVLATRYLDRRRFVELGLHIDWRWALDLGIGLVLGGTLMGGIFGIEWAAGWISVHEVAPWHALPAVFSSLHITLMAAASEELLSRGYQMKNGAEGLSGPRVGPRLAIALSLVATSLFFGLGHAGGPNSGLDSFLVLSAVGVLFAVSYILTGELGLCIGLHAGWNLFQGRFFGFSVSGHETTTSFIGLTQTGPELWTGGPYGPEAGLLGLGACVVGSALVIGWVRLFRGRVRLKTELTVPRLL